MNVRNLQREKMRMARCAKQQSAEGLKDVQ